MRALLRFLTREPSRCVLSWLLLCVVLGGRSNHAWNNFRNDDRPDGNRGHTTIDFGGQWMMGRLMAVGRGQELYSRAAHRDEATKAYPPTNEAPGRKHSDVECVVGYYPGDEADPVGGPLYPPIHSLIMAPLGAIPRPQVAYRIWQFAMLGCLLLATAGVVVLTRGRWWFSVAASLMLMSPGSKAALGLAQNSPITLMLIVWGWAAIVRGRPVAGGILFGLLAFKPVWAISFLLALLLLRQWRSAFVMCLVGIAQIAITIPFVGLHSWFDWLHVGSQAAELYRVDSNWIHLSRDLFGIPRRLMLDFDIDIDKRDVPLAGWLGWGLLFGIGAMTFANLRRRPPDLQTASLTGPRPAFVFFAAWLCTYHFIYYDAMLGLLGFVCLMADPDPWWKTVVRIWQILRSLWTGRVLTPGETAPTGLIRTMCLAGFVAAYAQENLFVPADLGVTVILHSRSITENGIDTAPSVAFRTNDEYPWDTYVILWLWVWSGIATRRTPPLDSDIHEKANVVA
jgi:arabinofuranan 3-O-arabinosyltransferase